MPIGPGKRPIRKGVYAGPVTDGNTDATRWSAPSSRNRRSAGSASSAEPSKASGRAPSATRMITGTRASGASACGEEKRRAIAAASQARRALARGRLTRLHSPNGNPQARHEAQDEQAGGAGRRLDARGSVDAHRRDAYRAGEALEGAAYGRWQARQPRAARRRPGPGHGLAAPTYRGRASGRRSYTAVAARRAAAEHAGAPHRRRS